MNIEILAKAALESFAKTEEENKYLSVISEAQQDIFDEIQQYEYDEEIEKLDKEIQQVQDKIEASHKFLMNLLTKSKEKEDDASIILKNSILQLHSLLINCTAKTLEQNQILVPIQNVLLIEDAIIKLIEKLVASGKIIETDEERDNRYLQLDMHGKRIMNLLEISKADDDGIQP